ncbi:hypothetical protein D3C87_1835460 [compost metagenome]
MKMRMTMASPGDEPMLRRPAWVRLDRGWLCRLSFDLGRKPPQATSPKATQSRISAEKSLRRRRAVKVGGPVDEWSGDP